MNLGNLLWRSIPIFAFIWALRSGVLDWGRTFESIRNSIRSVQTKVDLGAMGKRLIGDYSVVKSLPAEHHFTQWLRDSLKSRGRPVEEDYFGNEYALKHIPDGFIIKSAGPDGVFETDDDVSIQVDELARRAEL